MRRCHFHKLARLGRVVFITVGAKEVSERFSGLLEKRGRCAGGVGIVVHGLKIVSNWDAIEGSTE